MGLDPLAHLTERRGRAQPALAHPAHLLGLDQAGELQDPDVLLDPVEGQARGPCELAQRSGATAAALENAPPGGVAQREERRVERWRQCPRRRWSRAHRVTGKARWMTRSPTLQT